MTESKPGAAFLVSFYWKMQFGVEEKFRFTTVALSLCKKNPLLLRKITLLLTKSLDLKAFSSKKYLSREMFPSWTV